MANWVVRYNTKHPVKFELQINKELLLMHETYTKKLFICNLDITGHLGFVGLPNLAIQAMRQHGKRI